MSCAFYRAIKRFFKREILIALFYFLYINLNYSYLSCNYCRYIYIVIILNKVLVCRCSCFHISVSDAGLFPRGAEIRSFKNHRRFFTKRCALRGTSLHCKVLVFPLAIFIWLFNSKQKKTAAVIGAKLVLCFAKGKKHENFTEN